MSLKLFNKLTFFAFNNVHLNKKLVYKRFSSSIKVAIIGSGPAGFYTAQALLKNKNINIDIYEKALVPFGLIRFGVAPDHFQVKNVIFNLNKIALNNRVTFNGNVNIGIDITLEDLKNSYNVVVLCYGSTEDRCLNIEGENLSCVIPAKRFVGWYNGVEEDKNLDFNLDFEDVIIIGQGNVALDCARILLMNGTSHLKNTDITNYALEKLKKSKVKRVYLIGRRGPLQVAFKIKELREMTKIPNVQILLDKNELSKFLPKNLDNLSRPRRRLTELLIKISNEEKNKNVDKKFIIKFLRSPIKIIKLNEKGKVYLAINEFINEDIYSENTKVKKTDKIEELEFGLFLRSIGYKTVSIDKEIPIDEKTGIIKNNCGKVLGVGDNVYCSGWAATGANGVILGTMSSSFEVGKNILQHIEEGLIDLKEKCGHNEILSLLKKKSIKVITFNDWQKIDNFEQEKGKLFDKSKEKIVEKKEILNLLNKNN